MCTRSCTSFNTMYTSPSAREIIPFWEAKAELYYSLGIPIDKTKMHNGHPICVAQDLILSYIMP